MHRETVEKFEDSIRSVLGDLRSGQHSDVGGTAIGAEHETDLRRISAALLLLLEELAKMNRLWVSDRNLHSGRRLALTKKMLQDEDGDIVLGF
jgi:hypothetical protein